MDIDLDTIKNVLIPTAGVIITWLTKDRILDALNIKKEKNKVDSVQLENVQKALDVWQDMLDDAVKRHRAQVIQLEAVIVKLTDDLSQLEIISNQKDKVIKEQKILIEKQSASLKYYFDKYERNKEK